MEALHCLRASLLLPHRGRVPQVITFIGCPAQDPHTHKAEEAAPPLALTLAAVLAQHGVPVLFVDADLRSAPEVCSSADPGLSEMLSGAALPFTQSIAGLSLLSAVHAGARSLAPSELIDSPRMSRLLTAWRDEFSFIVIHGPAAVFADALALAQLSDVVLFATRAGESRRDEVVPAFHTLSRQVSDHAVLGLVLQGVSEGFPYAHA